MTSIKRKFALLIFRGTRALQHRNYRIFFIGQLFSLIGNWVTNIATAWLVYRLTGSAVLLGLVSFAGQFPGFLVSPFAGVHVDRLDRRKVLIVTQALSALQSLILAVLTLSGVITIPQLIALSVFQALIDGFYIPARQAYISELIQDRRDLANAIALNSASFHGARLIGPAIGGLLIAFTGEGFCFLIDSVSYIAVLISLFTIRSVAPARQRHYKSVLDELREGIQYVRTHRVVQLLISNVGIMCFLGITHSVLLPVLVREVFHGGAHDLGFLMGASGCGAMIGALTLAVHTSVDGLIHRIQRAGVLLGASVIALSFAPSVPIALIVLLLCGFSFITLAAGSNTLVQTLVQDRMRGRVMSFFAMSFSGMMPLGSVASGYFADLYSAQTAVFLSGVVTLICSIAFLLRSRALVPDLKQELAL